MKLDFLIGSVFLLLSCPIAAAAQLCVPEIQELQVSDPPHGGNFGFAVAVDGDTAVIGAPGDDEFGTRAGSAYVFIHTGAAWVQQAKLLVGTSGNHDELGAAVALDGDTVVLGASGGGSNNRAYVFVRQAGIWSQQAELVAPAGTHANHFGHSVAVHGETAVVGAPALSGGPVGAVHVFVRQGGAWSAQAELVDPTTGGSWAREFGKSVSLRQEVLAVGVPSAHLSGNFSGAVAVYRRSGTSWAQEDLIAGNSPSTYFGSAVALEGSRLIAGAPAQFYSGDSGVVWVYEEQGGNWVQTAHVHPSDPTTGKQFGAALALSGDAMVVGAWRDSVAGPFSGSAYAYHLVGSRWYQLEKLGPESGGASTENYGWSVALDGDRALVGRPFPQVGPIEGTAHHVRVPTPSGSANCHCASGSCANPDPSAGCANSTGSGANLIALGETDPDQVSFLVSGAVPMRYCAFFQADASAAPLPFGDGLICAGSGLVALNVPPRQIASNGTLIFGSCAGDPPISALGNVVPGSGVTRFYQLWYRDPGGPCGSNFNLSNGYEVTW